MSHPAQESDAASRPGEFFPGWFGRGLIGGSLLIVVAIRLLARLEYPPWPLTDSGLCNILTLIFAFLAGFIAWIWFCFVSGYSLVARRLVLIGSIVLIVAVSALFRLAEVSGSMVPRFVPRWSAIHDRSLGTVESQPATVKIDLANTTPDDFPQFLGPERRCWIAGPKLGRDWDGQPPKRLWKRPIGAGWSAFAAVNGYAVTLEQRGENEWVTCYEILSGNPVWGHAVKARHENPLGGIGPRSTPTIHQGRVYALGATGILRCIDGASGELLWHDDLQARYGLTQSAAESLVSWGRAGSPLIVDELVVVPGGGPAGKAYNLVAFHLESGKLAWEADASKPGDGADQISYSSPALATLASQRQIVIVNESTTSGHDPATGKTLWSHPWPSHSNADASSSQALPISDSHLFLSRGYSSGAELLEFIAAPAGKLEPKTLWKNPRVLQTKFTNAAAIGDHIYGLSEGILECVELAGGRRAWKGGRYGHGQILGVDDLLLVLAEDGRLALVAANPQKFSELGSIQALEGQTWNNLCLYGKLLLIRNGQEAACYELQ